MKPDYGIDAPGVVRNLFLFAALGLAIWGTVAAGLWSGVLDFSIGPVRFHLPLAGMGLGSGLGTLLMALWMLWEGRVGKLRHRERLLDRVAWRGDERVLDVGCGRGLMLIGAAKRLTSGQAIGIDIWQSVDLSGNNAAAAIENARREGVADRVSVQTADMRRMPFADGAFDVVVSRAAIHNLYDAADRAKALAEIARVLKPGGTAILDDIRHQGEYVSALARHGCPGARSHGSLIVRALLALLTLGSLAPGTVVARKAG
jgi:arsenite methyltransferase